MEGCFRRLLLVAGLLAALLPAAAATFGPQPGPPCEPTLLATQVALFCAPDMPTAQCCEPVVAAVDLGGGVPCLCRVAAEPRLVMAGLNATQLLTLYTSCGGLLPGGAHLAAACQGPASGSAAVIASPPSSSPRRKQSAQEAPTPPPSTNKPSPPSSTEKPAPPPKQQHSKAVPSYGEDLCDASSLALQVNSSCWRTGPACCESVVAAVDMGCLCSVAEFSETHVVNLGPYELLTIYRRCTILHVDDAIATRCNTGSTVGLTPAGNGENNDSSWSDNVILTILEVMGIVNAACSVLIAIIKNYQQITNFINALVGYGHG